RHPQEQAAVLDLNGWRPLALDDRQQVPLAPQVVAFPFDVFPTRLALLRAELRLLLPDPGKLRNCEDPDGVEAHPLRGGDAHAASGRVDAEMDVLDVLQDHVHSDVTELNLRYVSTHAAP